MAKRGLDSDVVASRIKLVALTRKRRDLSEEHKHYTAAFSQLTKALDKSLTTAEHDPEGGLAVARQCSRFVLEAMPDATQDAGRAAALSQFEILEHCLAAVRKPDEYLASMQKQFGPNLDPRNYKSGDAFNSIIKSQRQRLYMEGQGFNTEQEKIFCLKRRELLAAVERCYNRLRAQALEGQP